MSDTAPRELYLNADFDLSLGRRTAAAGEAARLVRELSLHGLLWAGPHDSVRVEEAVPAEFLDHLASHHLDTPSITLAPAIRRGARLVPFGWNEATEALAKRYDQATPHPPLAVVRRVNGRRFAAAIERELGDAEHVVAAIGSLDELERRLAGLDDDGHGWVAKAEHGNAGLGNRRLRSGALSETDRRVVGRLLGGGDALVLERWRARLVDLCATFELGANRAVSGLELHQLVNTADGAFIGALFDAASPFLAEWGPQLEATARTVAARLAAAGYFGPVCLDAFVWSDGGRPRLRPLVDCNARAHVSAGALRLWRVWGRERVVYWRLFSTRKLRLPADHAALGRMLGGDAFDPGERSGVLLASPLAVGEPPRPAARLATVLAARTRDEAFALERRFRDRFER